MQQQHVLLLPAHSPASRCWPAAGKVRRRRGRVSGWERGGGEREKKREREGEKLQLKKKKRKGGGLVAGQTGSAGRAGARPPAAPAARPGRWQGSDPLLGSAQRKGEGE